MTENQREQLKDIEKKFQSSSIGIIRHTVNLRTFPHTRHDINKYVRNCYGKPSARKLRVETDILKLLKAINDDTNMFAIDYTVLSYNVYNFTCGFAVEDFNTGELIAYYYFTKSKSICFEF